MAHVELGGSRRRLATGARRVRDVDPHAHIEVTLTLKAPELPEPGATAKGPMTVEELAKNYGAKPEDIRKVEQTLGSYGLTVEGISPTHRSLRASGTAAAMEAAFQAGLGIYQSADQGEFRGREGTVSVPSEIAGLVTSVLGLDQRRVARRRAAAPLAAATATPLTPPALEAHYRFPDGDGAGQKIAIAEFGSPLTNGSVLPPAYFPQDVTAFCQKYKRPVPKVATVPINISPLTLDQVRTLPTAAAQLVLEETTEVMMDVEIIAALCPAASISTYYASWDQKGWIDLLEQVTSDQPVALSISYGLAEDSSDWSQGAVQAINDALKAAALVGITACVSSGDDGSGCNMPDKRLHVEFPGSSPYVLSVGGTMFAGGAEVVWWESPGRRTRKGGGATGGGVSTVFGRPPWQTVHVPSLNPGALDGRVVPDVAALAGEPLYDLILLGHSAPNGGTSAAAPLWASLLARMNAALPSAKRGRFLAPLLYGKSGAGTVGAGGCTDITTGNNASHPQPGRGYTAGQGYDAVAGWGVPNGKALLALLGENIA